MSRRLRQDLCVARHLGLQEERRIVEYVTTRIVSRSALLSGRDGRDRRDSPSNRLSGYARAFRRPADRPDIGDLLLRDLDLRADASQLVHLGDELALGQCWRLSLSWRCDHPPGGSPREKPELLLEVGALGLQASDLGLDRLTLLGRLPASRSRCLPRARRAPSPARHLLPCSSSSFRNELRIPLQRVRRLRPYRSRSLPLDGAAATSSSLPSHLPPPSGAAPASRRSPPPPA